MKSLCESVPNLCKERCPELTPSAVFICGTFSKLFSTFAQCHSTYDSSKQLTDTDIVELGKHKYRIH